MGNELIHKDITVGISNEGMFHFLVDGEKFKASSFRQATEKIDMLKRKKRKPIQVPCWIVIDDGDDVDVPRVEEGEYCGIHAGWSTHTYRRKGDQDRHAANTWRDQEVIFPTQEGAEEYASYLRDIEKLRQKCEAVGFRIRRPIPGDFDARGKIEQEVADYLTGKRASPDVE